MTIWEIAEDGPKKIKETQFKKEKLLEEKLEDWITKDPTILGENLLIVGRQVLIQDNRDRLDILALDVQGNSVIIEIKRDTLKDPVDIQALRYASYVSKWRFENFENLAKNYYGKTDDNEFNFNSMFESFCSDAGSEEIPNVNEDQRIIIVGAAVAEKLGSVALWLNDHSVDIKLIEIKAFRKNDKILIQPNVLVPLQVSKFTEVGKNRPEKSPWLVNGREWHLEKRCSPRTKEVIIKFDEILKGKLIVEGPFWNQKYYISYRVNNHNWLIIHTKPKFLVFDFSVKANSFTSDKISEKLGIAKFELEESLTEKLNLPSSVLVRNINENLDRIRLRLKDDYNIEALSFLQFLEETYTAYPKTEI